MSGYFYNNKKFCSFGALLKNKSFSIGIPWLFLGTVSYLYNAILSKNFGILAYLKWIIGNGTYLYFLTVLFLLFLIFYRTNDWILYVACLLNVVSLALTAFGLIEPIISILHITNYLNIFNWCGIFAAGMIVRKKISQEKFYTVIKHIRIPTLVLFSVALVLLSIFDSVQVGYFSKIGIFLEILGTITIFSLSSFSCFANRVFYDISNMSFSIYLIHMMAVGILDIVYNIHFTLQAVASIIVIAFCYAILCFARFLIKLIRCEKYFNPLFGFRERKLEK